MREYINVFFQEEGYLLYVVFTVMKCIGELREEK